MEIKSWLGKRNTTSTERVNKNELFEATNVDLDNTGRILSRKGYAQLDANAAHSMYYNGSVFCVVQNSVLKAIENNLSLTTLKQLTTNDPVSFETIDNTAYYSNGKDTGRLVGRTWKEWGIRVPTSQPSAKAVSGLLPPGKYQYALVFVRSDGQESGTGLAGEIELSSTGGIQFSDIEVSTNADVTGKALYISHTNGSMLYRATIIPNPATTYSYTEDTMDLSVVLRTQFAGPPPAGNMVRWYNGVMYVVVGSTIYYSDPYNFELFRQGENFLQFPGQIAMFEAVNDGVYIATADTSGGYEGVGGTWFLNGDRPDKFKSKQLFDYGAISGTAVRTIAGHFSPEEADEAGSAPNPAIVWSSSRGVCIGFNGGEAKNLTEVKHSFPVAQRGAGVVRQERGYVQYIAVLFGAGAANNQYTEEI